MEGFVKGDVVVVPFPFSNLSSYKRRPALVLINLPGPDIVLCQITSKHRKDEYSILLNKEDFVQGGLDRISCVRIDRIFTAEKSIILRKAGNINTQKLVEVKNAFISLLGN
jgi:mRNA interferase MazF